MHTLLLTREMAALEYRTVLVAGSCEPQDGDMRYLLQSADSRALGAGTVALRAAVAQPEGALAAVAAAAARAARYRAHPYCDGRLPGTPGGGAERRADRHPHVSRQQPE